MSDSTPTQALAVTWRVRVVRRAAMSVGAAVVLAGIAPAIANAAGADVPNPVAVALRASGRGISTAFGGSSTDSTVKACDPTASPVVSVSTDSDTSESPEPSESGTPSGEVTATAVSSESASSEPVETTAVPSTEPTGSEGSDEDEDEGEECEDPTESESPSPTVAPTTAAPEAEGNHGQIVSTVAKCAPRGKDPLLDVEGAPSNHGGYVRVAAHGESLTTPWGTFDLSTQAGADALCAALDAAAEELSEEETEKEHGKKDKVKKEKGPKGGKGKHDSP